MSDINIEKDDQATQEMLKMMGELSEEMESTLEAEDNIQADALLDELEGLPTELEKEAPEVVEAVVSKEETPLDVDDIDTLMAEINETTEMSIEVAPPSSTTPLETVENTASKDADEHMEISSIENSSALEEPLEPRDETRGLDDIDDIDDIAAVQEIDESPEIEAIQNKSEADIKPTSNEDNIAPPEDIAGEDLTDINPTTNTMDNEITEEKESTESTVQVEQLISQTQQAVHTMEEAIQIDQEIQEIASNVHSKAQEAIQIAISTSEQAQQSTEQIQQAIEATFSASEEAFKAAEKAGYQINLDDINTDTPTPEIIEQLQEIEAKNKKLKEVNQNLKQRISELKQP